MATSTCFAGSLSKESTMKHGDFKKNKVAQKKITMVTCYDFPSACILSESQIDCALVGDSVAMMVHGYENTLMATMEMMILHTRAVARGLNNKFLVVDLPFLAHKGSRQETIHQVRALIQAGAQAIKIEGGDDDTIATISYLIRAGVPIIGHIGLTPQSLLQLGGYKIQGKTPIEANNLLHQAQQLEQAGCLAIVVECVPSPITQQITTAISIPTIGIGAGPQTDGQVLVWHDLLGLQTAIKPKFVRQYAQIKSLTLQAVNKFAQDVKQAHFPTLEHSF